MMRFLWRPAMTVILAAQLHVSGEELTWPQFRGPGGGGVNDSAVIPDDLGPERVAWMAQPGHGHSSPVLCGSQLILTAYDGGLWSVVSLDRLNGNEIWRWKIEPGSVERGHRNGSPAASSVAVSPDGLIVAYSGAYGLVCLDTRGREVWKKPLPTPVTQHGAGTSPVIADDRVILCVDQDVDSHIQCLDLRSGLQIWRTSRPGFRRGFSTPLVWKDESGTPRGVLMCGTLRAVMYDLHDGTPMWSVDGLPNEMCATPVYDSASRTFYICGWTNGAGVSRLPDFSELLQTGDDNNDGLLSREESPQGSPARMHFPYVDADKDGLITAEEYESLIDIFRNSRNALMAVSLESAGSQSEAKPVVKWVQTRGLPYVPSPLLYRGAVYIIKNGGMISCFDQHTGEPHYMQERVGAIGDYYASPVAGGGRILCASQSGVLTVLRAGPDFEVVCQWDTGGNIFATPCLDTELIYVRTSNNLIAIRAAATGLQ